MPGTGEGRSSSGFDQQDGHNGGDILFPCVEDSDRTVVGRRRQLHPTGATTVVEPPAAESSAANTGLSETGAALWFMWCLK